MTVFKYVNVGLLLL